MKIILYIIWQCTWGFLQTTLGLFVFLIHCKKRHYIYHGAIVTEWESKTCVSLGLFVFVTGDGLSEQLLVHEYGHTIQSLMLGPLYLLTIGIPSALWYSLPWCKKKRKDNHISYYSFYTEKWADRLGEKVVRKGIPYGN